MRPTVVRLPSRLLAPRLATGLALASALVLAVAACGDSTGPGGDADAITRLPRDLTPAELQIVERSAGFGLELMAGAVASDPRPNVVLSPLSASMALGMTLNGAAGATFDAMRATLGFDGLSQPEINAGYRGLLDLLVGLDPRVDVGVANAVFANEDFPFHAAFFETLARDFDARAESRDFGDPSTLADLNGWVDDETGGLIPRLLQELDPDLRMVLLNAVYFDAAWTDAFDPADTAPADFRRADGSTVRVQLMSRSEAELPYAAGPGWAAVELPYGGGAFALVVVVPTGDDDIRSFVETLDGARWDALVDALGPTLVDRVAIPKFRIAHDAFLNPVLTDMGMGIAFTDAADFTGLSPRGHELCVDFVRQKTFVEVDEAGTRAAAATAVGIGPDSFLGVQADRPFFFALRERLSGTLLFTGLVGDPTVEDSGEQDGEGMCH